MFVPWQEGEESKRILSKEQGSGEVSPSTRLRGNGCSMVTTDTHDIIRCWYSRKRNPGMQIHYVYTVLWK